MLPDHFSVSSRGKKGTFFRHFVLRLGGALVSTVASQPEGPGFESESVCFCVGFACSPSVCVGLLQFPPTVQKHVSWRLVG